MTEKEFQKLFKKAKNYASIEQFDKAISIFEKLHQERKENIEVLRELSFHLNDAEKALHYIEKAEQLAPIDVRVRFICGLYFHKKEEFEKSKEVFAQLKTELAKIEVLSKEETEIYFLIFYLEKEYDLARKILEKQESIVDIAYFWFGQIEFHQNKDYQKAIEFYKIGIEKHPNNLFIIYFSLGDAYYNSNQYNESLDYYLKALEYNSKHFGLLSMIVNCYEKLCQFEKQLEYNLKLYKINPKNTNTIYNLAQNYSKLNENKFAFKYFQKLFKLEPENYDYYIIASYCFENYKESEDRIKFLNRLLKKFPEKEADIYSKLADAYRATDKLEYAFGHSKKARELSPNDPSLISTHINILSDLGQKEEAEKLLLESLEKYLDYFYLFSTAGWFYISVSNYEKALEYFEKFLEKNDSYNSIGFTYYLMDNNEKAIEFYNKAIERNPWDGFHWSGLANVYFYQNELEKALEIYFKASELSKNGDSSILISISKCYLRTNSLDNAIEYAERAKSVLPRVALHLVQLGSLYEDIYSYTNKEEHYKLYKDLFIEAFSKSPKKAFQEYEKEKNQKLRNSQRVREVESKLEETEKTSLLKALNHIASIFEAAYIPSKEDSNRFESKIQDLDKDIQEVLLEKYELVLRWKAEHESNSRLASVTEFTNGVSHEYGQPITNIRYTIQYYRKKFQKKFLMEDLNLVFDSILKETERMGRLTKKLSILSSKNPIVNLDIVEVIQSRIEGEKVRLTENQIDVKLSPQDKPIYYKTEHASFEQIVSNLLLNSIDALSVSTENQSKSIEIHVKENDNLIQIDWMDSGTGILQENHFKVFDPFFSTKTHGEGLGLFIVSKLLKRRGGKIRIDSKCRNGTKFILEFPKE